MSQIIKRDASNPNCGLPVGAIMPWDDRPPPAGWEIYMSPRVFGDIQGREASLLIVDEATGVDAAQIDAIFAERSTARILSPDRADALGLAVSGVMAEAIASGGPLEAFSNQMRESIQTAVADGLIDALVEAHLDERERPQLNAVLNVIDEATPAFNSLRFGLEEIARAFDVPPTYLAQDQPAYVGDVVLRAKALDSQLAAPPERSWGVCDCCAHTERLHDDPVGCHAQGCDCRAFRPWEEGTCRCSHAANRHDAGVCQAVGCACVAWHGQARGTFSELTHDNLVNLMFSVTGDAIRDGTRVVPEGMRVGDRREIAMSHDDSVHFESGARAIRVRER